MGASCNTRWAARSEPEGPSAADPSTSSTTEQTCRGAPSDSLSGARCPAG